MKKILISLAIIAAISAILVGATTAFFSDTETSTGNTFTAGAIDLKIDNTSYAIDYTIPNYPNPTGALVKSEGTSWELDELDGHLFFDFHDLKPGDLGEDTISIHVDNNNAWACVDVLLTANDDVTCTEPELTDDPDCTEPGEGTGELAEELNFLFWVDDGDNVLEVNELDQILASGPASQVGQGVQLAIADSVTNNVGGADGEPLTGGETYYIGKAWCYGEMSLAAVPTGEGQNPTVNPGVTCDGGTVDNASQTDKLMGDVSFYAVQSRNNPNFVCTVTEDIGCVDKADVMLTLDRSGSISSSEMDDLQDAAKAFVTAMNPLADGIHMGEVSFASMATLDVHLTDDATALNTAIDALYGSGMTNLEDAIQESEAELDNPGSGYDRIDGESPDYMVIITDGIPTASNGPLSHKDDATAAATAAKVKGIIIYVVGIGGDVDGTYLANNIATSPAHYYSATNWSDLETLLQGIGTCP